MSDTVKLYERRLKLGLLSQILECHLHLDVTALVHGVDILEGGGGGWLRHRVWVSSIGDLPLWHLNTIGIQEHLLGGTIAPVDPVSRCYHHKM